MPQMRFLVFALAVAGCTYPHDPAAGTFVVTARMTSYSHPVPCPSPADPYCYKTDTIAEKISGVILVDDNPHRVGSLTSFEGARVILATTEYHGVVEYGWPTPWQANVQLGSGPAGRIPSANLVGTFGGDSIYGTITSTSGTEASPQNAMVKTGTFVAYKMLYYDKPARGRETPISRRLRNRP
jgi:hypothetical protein